MDSALECGSRWGVAKTSLDDVARQAGCSRATIYRLFPGGKASLVQAVIIRERDWFLASVAEAVGRSANLEDALVAGITQAGRLLMGSETLQYMLAFEPELILPYLAFGPFEELLAAARDALVPLFGRFLDVTESGRLAEWVGRIVLSYLTCPSPHVDLTDDASVRRLIGDFVLPGITTAYHESSANVVPVLAPALLKTTRPTSR